MIRNDRRWPNRQHRRNRTSRDIACRPPLAAPAPGGGRSGWRGPAYLAIVEALAADLAATAITPGTRILPQREMAGRLGLSVGTVAKAYAEAARRGLIAGEVGRGTYVSAAAEARRAVAGAAMVDMSLNTPPESGAGPLIAAAMAKVAASGEVAALLDYLPHAGVPAHRAAMAAWLAEDLGRPFPAAGIVLCNGAQHGIALALMAALAPGDTVLVEAVTYPGIAGIAARLGHRLHGVALDAEGLVPAALDEAFALTGARALYCMPTLQTPTGAVMSAARREAIVTVLRRHDAWAIEDDVYAFLAPAAGPALATLAPERVAYVGSLAKCLAPGLRIGVLAVPTALRGQVNTALRGTGWMASPLLTATAAQLLRCGAVRAQMQRKRAFAAERWRLAKDSLGCHVRFPETIGFHLWLPTAGTAAEIVTAAAAQGVVLAPPLAIPGARAPEGLRLCLGAPTDLTQLQRGLGIIAAILDQGGGRALV
uniref:PLP-dependent aminotransferase family protein n=1 Tax=Acidicaldus sp. TaxID=1872105 RepID=A0A8J4HBT5_9PROT